MTARYWYIDKDGRTVTMEWRPWKPMTEEDQPIPDDEAPEELPDEPPEKPDLEQPKTDEPEE